MRYHIWHCIEIAEELPESYFLPSESVQGNYELSRFLVRI